MLRRNLQLWCSAAAAQTLTAWLSKLAAQAEALPFNGSGTPALNSSSSSAASSSTSPAVSSAAPEATQLFAQLEDAAQHANALRETDTLFTVLHTVLRKRHYPADPECWARLAQQLLPYGGVEAQSVLHYPGTPTASLRRGGALNASLNSQESWGASGSLLHSPYESNVNASQMSSGSGGSSLPAFHLEVTRETLLMTGGVVPLSARVPCGDGRMIALFLDSFTAFVRWSCGAEEAAATPSLRHPPAPAVLKAVRSVAGVVLHALQANAATLQWELLLPSLLDHLTLLHQLDMLSAAAALSSAGAEADAAAEGVDGDDGEEDAGGSAEEEAAAAVSVEADAHGGRQRTRLLQRMANGLAHRSLTHGAAGARAVLMYLSDHFADTVSANESSVAEAAQLAAAEARQLYWMQQRYLLALTRSCMRAIYLHYTPSSRRQHRRAAAAVLSRSAASSSALSSSSSSSSPYASGHPASHRRLDLVASAPINAKIDGLYAQIDVLFQRNTNDGNPLRLDDAAVSQLKDVHTLALLRALRLEEAAPDQYLRRALEVVDRVSASMAIEGELIAGKVRLLDLDNDSIDEEGRTAVYRDLLTSLRSLVEMRPRLGLQEGAQSDGTSVGVGEGAGDAGEGGDDDGDGAAVRLDAVTQGILQRAHADVITAFCASHREEWLSEAYAILVAHKYHGLKITKDLIQPVLTAFSRRGDCRAFNLVDLCVLYSNETIDMRTIALLFRTCAAAGDHYRARSLLQLLNEIIPGFLVKCPPAVKESLQELKLLSGPPRHLFVSAEEDLVQSALGAETQSVRRLPDAA